MRSRRVTVCLFSIEWCVLVGEGGGVAITFVSGKVLSGDSLQAVTPQTDRVVQTSSHRSVDLDDAVDLGHEPEAGEEPDRS